MTLADTGLVSDAPKPWDTVGALVEQKFGELAESLNDLYDEKKDIDLRIEATRELIAPHIKALAHPVDALGRRFRWQGESETQTLDRGLLVKAGVTPDQIEAGLKKGKRKAFLRVDPITEGA
jgi:hypothetical protein